MPTLTPIAQPVTGPKTEPTPLVADRDSVPVLPPPPLAASVAPAAQQALRDALAPAPAATRRAPPPLEVRAPLDPSRRRTDSAAPPFGPAPGASHDDDFNTVVGAEPIDLDDPRLVESAPTPVSGPAKTGITPPPTRIHRDSGVLADRPFTPPKVHPVPEKPDGGLVPAAKYAVNFWRARYQRRGAIKLLGIEIKQDTEALDQVLGSLGRAAREAKLEGRVFSAENGAIETAEQRIATLDRERIEVDARKADENSKYIDVESERQTKLTDAERIVAEAAGELQHHEGLRRGLREQRKELERRQKAYLKAAEDTDRQSAAAQMGDTRAELRRSAEQHRKEAAALEPDRQDIDRRLQQLEKPIADASTKLDTAKTELDAAKRSLSDAREGHTHRLAELDAEQKRKAREMAQAEGEIQRRLVTLGTLVNLNRVDGPADFAELFERIDRLRGAITARTTEIEKLTFEREAFDRSTLLRGIAVIGGSIVAVIAFIVLLRACL